MYEGVFDEESRIFYATLSGSVSVDELAQSLRTALSQEYGDCLRVLWRTREMQVDFALAEATQLVEFVQKSGVPKGRMAFVSGEGFIKSVIETVRASSDQFSTEWQTFEKEAEALAWLND